MEWSKVLDMPYTLLAHRWQKGIPADTALTKEKRADLLENGRALIYKGKRNIKGYCVDGIVKSIAELSIGGEYKDHQLARAWDQNKPIESIQTLRKIKMLNKNNSTKRPEYLRWCGLKARCLNKTNNRYYLYGGRGIKVHEPWIKDFWAFLDYIGDMPGPEYTVDRIDPDKHYEPGNVRWLHKKEQINTRRITLTATMNGEKKTLKQWAIQYGMTYETVRNRIRRGWSIEDALAKERCASGKKRYEKRQGGGT